MSTETTLDFVRTTLSRAQGALQAVQEFIPKGTTAAAIAHDCGESVRVLDFTKAHIHELETALNRFVLVHENLLSETDGTYPPADTGCIDCTSGTVPDKYNTGPCPYHTAKRLLGQL